MQPFLIFSDYYNDRMFLIFDNILSVRCLMEEVLQCVKFQKGRYTVLEIVILWKNICF